MSKEITVNLTIETLTELVYELLPGGSTFHKLLNFNHRLKKARTDSFMDLLREDFERFVARGGRIEENKILNEHFVDCFETIWRNVVATRSEEKIKYYRNILFRQVVEPDEHHSFLKMISYIDRLNEIQIFMLDKICSGTHESPRLLECVQQYKQFKGMISNFEGVENEFPEIQSTLQVIRDHQETIDQIGTGQTFPKEELLFFLLELKNYGFIEDINEESGGATAIFGGKNYKLISSRPIYVTTRIGVKLLDFIKEYVLDEEE